MNDLRSFVAETLVDGVAFRPKDNPEHLLLWEAWLSQAEELRTLRNSTKSMRANPPKDVEFSDDGSVYVHTDPMPQHGGHNARVFDVVTSTGTLVSVKNLGDIPKFRKSKTLGSYDFGWHELCQGVSAFEAYQVLLNGGSYFVQFTLSTIHNGRRQSWVSAPVDVQTHMSEEWNVVELDRVPKPLGFGFDMPTNLMISQSSKGVSGFKLKFNLATLPANLGWTYTSKAKSERLQRIKRC